MPKNPRAPRERPRGLLEAILEPPGLHLEVFFGSFLGAPGTSFSSFFGAVQGRCACCHCVPQMLGRRISASAGTRRPLLAVRRACLRRRAFYASPCQATAPSLERFTHRAHSAGPLRPEVELTPSKVRKNKPIVHRCSMLFQDDLGVENGSQNEIKIVTTSCLGAFQDALGAGLPLEAILASILVHFWISGTPKNRALAVARCYFCRK